MAKSNMRSVANRRAIRLDDNRQKADRAERRQQHRGRAPIRRNPIRRFIDKMLDWFGKTPMVHLDLRKASDFKRSAGAHQLRTWWPGLGKMVSTRDGQSV